MRNAAQEKIKQTGNSWKRHDRYKSRFADFFQNIKILRDPQLTTWLLKYNRELKKGRGDSYLWINS